MSLIVCGLSFVGLIIPARLEPLLPIGSGGRGACGGCEGGGSCEDFRAGIWFDAKAVGVADDSFKSAGGVSVI